MNNPPDHPAHQAAQLALQRARAECLLAGLDPGPHAEDLTQFVIAEVRKALTEMAEHQAHGGPTAILMLAQPQFQKIYFCDAARLAAKALLKKLNIKTGIQIH